MKKVPLSSPDIIDKDINAVVGVMKTRFLSIEPKMVEFEKIINEYIVMNSMIEINNIVHLINKKYYLVKHYAY